MSSRWRRNVVLIALWSIAWPSAAAALRSEGDAVRGGTVAASLVRVDVHASSDPARSREEREAWEYNSDYLFGLSRSVANSFLEPAVKPFLFIVTVPLDIALLPIAAIGGLFGRA